MESETDGRFASCGVTLMIDVVFVALTAGFFLLSWLYVRALRAGLGEGGSR